MKIDKRKLFEAIQNKVELEIRLSYPPNLFDYSTDDFTFNYKGLEFRSFSGYTDFEETKFVENKDIPDLIEGFGVLENKLQTLGCLLQEEIKKEIKEEVKVETKEDMPLAEDLQKESDMPF